MAVLFTSALSGTKANLVGEYTINYQDVANNKTNVTATLSIVSTGYYLSGISTIFFNGSQYNPYINIPQWGRQVVATQTYDINHNPDGTGSISISGSCNVANGSFQASGSGGAGLPTIPRASQPSLVTFPNSTDNIFIGDRITIHFNRKSTSFTHKIQLLFDGYNPYLVENPIGGDNWVWDTSINATEIYKKMPTVNRKQGTIRLYTYNGGTLIGSKDVNFIANIKDANPIFTNFEYEIIDDKSISLTGNNKTAIKSFSNVKAIVSNINKAQAQKEATITKYKFVCGNKQIEVPYNDDTEMLLEQIDNITMNVYAIDSRGNSTMVGKTFDNFIEYENIKITELNANRLNGVDTQTNLSYKGNYWGKSFGEVSNTIKSVKYEYKEIDGTEWVLGETDITPKKGEEEIDLGKFDFSGLIKGDLEALGFALNKSFNIKVTISDELSTFSLETILSTGTPNLAIAKSGISIGSKYDESVGGKVQGIYEIGDLFISTKNENPSIRFGGTWEQIKDVFLLACGDKYKAGATGGSDKHTLTKAEVPHLGSGVKYGGNTLARGSGWSDDWLGGGDTPQSFSIMPPYLAVYVWVRTA